MAHKIAEHRYARTDLHAHGHIWQIGSRTSGWYTVSPRDLTDAVARMAREIGHNGRSRVAVNERSGYVIVGVDQPDGTAVYSLGCSTGARWLATITTNGERHYGEN